VHDQVEGKALHRSGQSFAEGPRQSALTLVLEPSEE
jgi:hypothetical protein